MAQETTSPTVDGGYSVNLIQIIIGLLTAFSAGGIVGIAGLAMFVDRIRNDVATVTALEKLGASFPPETRELLKGGSRSLVSIGELGEEVFDDEPIAQKRPQINKSDYSIQG